jgi:uncharacterized protein (TIGR02145 family)
MKNCIILFLLVITILPLDLTCQVPESGQQQKKVALVIGNGNYSTSVLANPENDARAMTAVLKKLDFTVQSYTNLEQKDLKKAIDDFSVVLKDAYVALFYYAGHGIQSGGLNYLVPVDATLQTEAHVEYDCVPADRVMALIEESGARIKIMILDACRNNPFEGSWTRAASGKGLASMKAPNNTFIAYSTAPGSTALDGSGNNSLYTSALLESIILPNLTIDQVFQNVGRIVSQKSDNKQIPWKSSSLIMDFYFNKENTTNSEVEGADYFLDPRDNKNYKTVKIGSQYWTQRNLNYLTFNNGDTIPEIKNLAAWLSAKSPASCVYNNISSSEYRYGRLYNKYTAMDVRNLCPAGWHIPTNSDWDQLIMELGGSGEAGGKMKETGNGNWISPNIAATNSTGFSALPSGSRDDKNDYINLGRYAGFFSSDGSVRSLTTESGSIQYDTLVSLTNGYSIRCVKGRNPLAKTDTATSISARSATLNGKVNPNQLYTEISFEYGNSTDYGLSVSAMQSPAGGSVPAYVSAEVPDLKPGAKYHFRVKASNISGVTYGDDQTFTTIVPPSAVTKAATSISASAALLKGLVKSNNNAKTVVTFEYGTSTDYGNTVTANPSPVTGNDTITVSYSLTGLAESTSYYFRVKAEASNVVTMGENQTFSTLRLPISETDTANAVASSSATLRGTVNFGNLLTKVSFEYGTTDHYGKSIDAGAGTVISNSKSLFSVPVKGLMPDSNYHYRIKAENIAGTTYGNDMTFRTPGVLEDFSGNIYKTIYIGKQVWMAENLRTTKFNDGTSIPLVTSEKAWSRLKKPGYCWYNNDTSFNSVTGVLYNWYTVNSYKLCPAGWHPPSNAEWSTLVDYVGEASIAGGAMKEAGTSHWQKPNEGATNESGFTALPGGSRDLTGSFVYYGLKAMWWSAEDSSAKNAWFQSVDFTSERITSYQFSKTEGYSVRCIRDEQITVAKKDTTEIEEPDFIIDPRDNFKYQTVKMGGQLWMVENLRATKFNDNTEIPLVIDKISWNRLESPAYCWYENLEAYKTYGALYNWNAVITGKLCPVGWHIPTDEDWTALINMLGGRYNAAGYLKEYGNAHWEKPNSGFVNTYNFKALPGGYRDENGEFFNIGKYGYWWSPLKSSKASGEYQILYYGNNIVNSKSNKNKPIGLSVRCIKD